jgi:hypothetical protein
MNDRLSPKRLFGLGRGLHHTGALDPADLGTAFGMEVTLDQPPAPAPAPPGAAGQAGWMQRLRWRRRRPA